MCRKFLVLLSMSLLLNFSAYAQSEKLPDNQTSPKEANEPTVIKQDVTLVNLTVFVSDKNNRFIPDLQAKNFSIYEDYVQQEIAFFSSKPVSFNFVLLINVSNTCFCQTKDLLDTVKEAVLEFVTNLSPDDHIVVTSFANELITHWRGPASRLNLRIDPNKIFWDPQQRESLKRQRELLNADLKLFIEAVRSIRWRLNPNLYDAIFLTARNELKRIAGRKALILVTDGSDRSSLHTAREAMDEIVESGALVYVLRWQDTYYAHRPQNAELFLEELVDRTGGMFYDATLACNLTEMMKRISAEFRHVYTIGYYPSNPVKNGELRTIRVKMQNPQAVLRYKKSYVTTPIILSPR